MLPASVIMFLLGLLKQGAIRAAEFLIEKITQLAASVAGVDLRVLLVSTD